MAVKTKGMSIRRKGEDEDAKRGRGRHVSMIASSLSPRYLSLPIPPLLMFGLATGLRPKSASD
eukprot:3150738-Pyramimonas_sp.AAC.1